MKKDFPISSSNLYPSSPAVNLQHGLTNSADDWIMADPQNSTAYVLANAGFDVWLGNSRGNKYSRKNAHIDRDKDPKNFFDYSSTVLEKTC